MKIIPGQTSEIVLTPPGWADGVLIATVKNADGTPVAERLVFHQAPKRCTSK